MFVFSYGSLIIPDSASAAIGRSIQGNDLIDSVLIGFKRSWGGCSPIVFEENPDSVVNGAFYDIVSVNGAFVMGVLLEVSKDDLSQLVVREKQYDLLDVSSSIYCNKRLSGPIYTFIMKPALRINDNTPNSYIPLRYESRIDSAARNRGTHFFEHFVSTTIPSSLKRISGLYKFFDSEQQNRV